MHSRKKNEHIHINTLQSWIAEWTSLVLHPVSLKTHAHGFPAHLGGRLSSGRLSGDRLVGVGAVGGEAEEDVVEDENMAVLSLRGVSRGDVTLPNSSNRSRGSSVRAVNRC